MNGTVDRQIDSLLGLRVLATFLVVFGHAASFLQVYPATQWPQFPYVQSIAVIIFFCVSGYTIAWVCDTRKMKENGTFNRFIFDRFTRLAVPLLPTLILFGVVEYIVFDSQHPYIASFTFFDGIGNFFMLQRVIPGIEPLGLNRPLWTLSIEFWLYAAFGAIFFFSSAAGKHRATLASIAILAVVLLVPFLVKRHGSGLPVIWALSASLYFLLKNNPVTGRFRLWLFPMLASSFTCIFIPFFWDQAEYGRLFMLLVFANFAFFIALAPTVPLPSIVWKCTVFMSGFCYSVYLTHYPLMYLLQDLAPPGKIGAWMLVAFCFAFGWIFSIPFESRYKLIRDRLWILCTSVVIKKT